jgi:hypothetical protein
MPDFSLILGDAPLSELCAVCDDAALWPRGPRLVHVPTGRPVCRECGKEHAARYAAVVELLHVADRVGRHSRHLLTPAMKSLLDLARAAEMYANTSGPTPARVG